MAAPCVRLQLVRGPVRKIGRGRPFNGIVRRHVNQSGAIEFFRACFNGLAAFTLIVLMGAAVGGGDLAATGVVLLFILASYPLGALGFAVVSDSFLETIANPYARAFLSWAPFFVLGWLQWAVIFPAVRSLVQRVGRRKRAV